MLNDPVVSIARQPRGVVQVQGWNKDGSKGTVTRIDAWVRWEVDNNIYYEADTFRVTFALSALPMAFNEAWWASQQEIFVEILAGFPVDAENYAASELQSLTYGRVDDVVFDPVARTLEISGRDLTATMIDTKTTETFQNLSSSQIATKIAQRHGLTPFVTKTPGLTGKFYEIDNVRTNQQRSEWDLLTALAGEEQFIVYVKRKELHFEPAPAANAVPYQLKWEPPSEDNGAFSFNGKSIQFSRSLTLARGVVVTVVSKNQRGQKIKVTFPQKAATIRPGQSAPAAQQYSYSFAHMTYQEALKKAQQLHADISRHEVKLTAALPADNILQVSNLIAVVGTGTDFDQTYYPESITREMDVNSGYAMCVKAKNHSPQSVIPL